MNTKNIITKIGSGLVLIEDIFKVGLYNTVIDTLDLKELKDHCLHYANNIKGRTVSNISGGYQSKDLFIEDIKDTPIEKMIDAANYHMEEYRLGMGHKNRASLTNLWINVNYYKDYNTSHSHPGSMYNGVFYVDLPEDSGRIEFESPAYEKVQYDWNDSKTVKEFNNYNAHIWYKDPLPGSLLIFPSWINHRVRPNHNKDPRITIAFNYR
tara:strand:- start:166 stop:795 length:630 start_codon:yes stop_codon:yes gene_type:complete